MILVIVTVNLFNIFLIFEQISLRLFVIFFGECKILMINIAIIFLIILEIEIDGISILLGFFFIGLWEIL